MCVACSVAHGDKIQQAAMGDTGSGAT
jgi:hypothetical protein